MMVPDQVNNQKRVRSRLGVTAVIFILSLLMLSGCLGLFQGNSANDTTAISPYSGTVEFQCNEACADRGQCGQSADGTDFVFMSSIAAAVDGHNQLILPGTQGTIVNTITRTLQTTNGLETLTKPFHEVQVDEAVKGWVAEWCVVPVR